jgi:hypothetical protein
MGRKEERKKIERKRERKKEKKKERERERKKITENKKFLIFLSSFVCFWE